MDYKIIVILLVLLFLIILIYKEISTLKDQVDKTIMTTTIASKQLNDRHETTMQHNMDKYLSQIKTIGTENLQQLKKITLLNHQPIIKKKTSNHFTETDGSEIKSNLQHLSDVKGNKHKIFENQHNSHYYMSEETKKTKNSNYLSQNAEQSPNQKFSNVIPIYNDELSSSNYNDDTDADYDDSSESSSENSINPVNEIMAHQQNLGPNEQQFSISFVNTVLNEQHVADLNIIQAQFNNSINTVLNEQHIVDLNNIQAQLNNSINTFDNLFNNGPTIPIFTNNFVVQYDTDDDNDNNDNADIESVSSGSINLVKQSVSPLIIQEPVQELTPLESIQEEPVPEVTSLESVQELVLVEPIQEPNLVEIINDEHQNAEEIAKTTKIPTLPKAPSIVINTQAPKLKTIDEYTINELKALAKNLSIPTTYRHQNKTKQYKKEDLYNYIKNKY